MEATSEQQVAYCRLLAANSDVGAALSLMSLVALQGPSRIGEGNHREQAASLLERAAAHVRGKELVVEVDPKHINNKPGS